MERMKILTWPADLWSLKLLSQLPHDFYLPVCGLLSGDLQSNLHEIPKAEVPSVDFDLILFQSPLNFERDQHQLLSSEQFRLPKVFWQQQAPACIDLENPHPVSDPDVLVVHSSAYSRSLWDHAPGVRSLVIEPGVRTPEGLTYEGDWEKGVSVCQSGREEKCNWGRNLFEKARAEVPLDMIRLRLSFQAQAQDLLPADFPKVCSHYRFFLSTLRTGSLDLGFFQALMTGLPVLGMACGEIVSVIENGRSGFLHTDLDKLVSVMQEMIKHPVLAREWGKAARKTAMERFHLDRFIKDWNRLFSELVGRPLKGAGLRGAMMTPEVRPISNPGIFPL